MRPTNDETARREMETSPCETGPMTSREESPSTDDAEPFGTWLLAQVHRDGWISDLVKAAKADRGFPRDGDPEAVRRHLNEKQAESDMLEAVDDAESLWLRL